MNIYVVVFIDGTRAEVNALNATKAVEYAQDQHKKTVHSVGFKEKVQEIQQVNTFESLRRGGPNF